MVRRRNTQQDESKIDRLTAAVANLAANFEDIRDALVEAADDKQQLRDILNNIYEALVEMQRENPLPQQLPQAGGNRIARSSGTIRVADIMVLLNNHIPELVANFLPYITRIEIASRVTCQEFIRNEPQFELSTWGALPEPRKNELCQTVADLVVLDFPDLQFMLNCVLLWPFRAIIQVKWTRMTNHRRNQ